MLLFLLVDTTSFSWKMWKTGFNHIKLVQNSIAVSFSRRPVGGKALQSQSCSYCYGKAGKKKKKKEKLGLLTGVTWHLLSLLFSTLWFFSVNYVKIFPDTLKRERERSSQTYELGIFFSFDPFFFFLNKIMVILSSYWLSNSIYSIRYSSFLFLLCLITFHLGYYNRFLTGVFFFF